MLWERRGPGSKSGRRRAAILAARPAADALEARQLLATAVELNTTQSANLGTQLIGANANAGAGYTVTNVGNVTGGGYDSYVVAAPSTGFGGDLGTGGSAIYLVFGTKPTTSSAATGVANLTAALRGGDLATLGLAGGTQVNPTVAPTNPATPGFQFDGLKFVTGLNAATGLGTNSQLGASVSALGDINGDGYADFMVGAPNDAGGGRSFLIYGGPQLTTQTTKVVDLEPTAGVLNPTTPTRVVSFASSTGSDFINRIGTAGAGVRNFFANNGQGIGNATDLAIGDPIAPNAAGVATGAVYVLSGTRVNALAAAGNTTIDLATTGTIANPIGVTFQGVFQGDQTGFSLAASGALDLTAATTAGGPNLLIGAPGSFGGTNSGGRAYLIASTQATPSLLALGTTQSLATVGSVPTTTVPATLTGDLYQGAVPNGQLGYAVSSATDLNADGVADIALGAPGSLAAGTAANGYVVIVYGPETTFATQATTPNSYAITPAATSQLAIPTAYYTGAASGDEAGFSLAPAYLASNFSGSARGLLIGSPGYNIGDGTAYYLPAATTATTITPAAPVLADLPTASLFQFVLTPSATNPAAPPLASFSSLGNSVSARPLFSADSASSTGDFFFGAPGFSLKDPANQGLISRNLSGAQFTISAAALPGNSAGGGTTPPPNPGTGIGAFLSVPLSTTYIQASPIFTGVNNGQPYPTLTSLSHKDSYKPLPVQLAYQQFRPAQGFAARQEVYHNGGKGKAHQAPAGTILGVPQLGRNGMNKYNKVNTLPHGVFTRGKFKIGKQTTFTHKVKVIPRNQQTQTFPG